MSGEQRSEAAAEAEVSCGRVIEVRRARVLVPVPYLELVRIPACPACGEANPKRMLACPGCGEAAPNLTDQQRVEGVITGGVPTLARLFLWAAARLHDLARFIERR